MNENEWLKETHPTRLGELIGSLHTVEMLARLFLAKREAGCFADIQRNILKLRKGDQAVISPISDSRALKPVLIDYNNCVDEKSKVDVEAIVFLRDALAHGRVFGCGTPQNGHLRLLKFEYYKEKPPNGKVNVVLCEDMTDDWFADKRKLIEQATENIRKALGWLQHPIQ